MWIVWIALGVLIGWNLPQPQYAKDMQTKLVAWVRTIIR
jgi:hypothetical protein